MDVLAGTGSARSPGQAIEETGTRALGREKASDSTLPRKTLRFRPGAATLEGDLQLPVGAAGIVVFANGTGSTRRSPRDRFVAAELCRNGFGTLLLDLLTPAEELVDRQTFFLRFDIELLADRLVAVVGELATREDTRGLPIGFLASSTGAAAALLTAARLGEKVRTVVSRGGRPDLARSALPRVRAATLLVVGDRDGAFLRLNRKAMAGLRCEKALRIIPSASHFFDEPGALENVARLSSRWFSWHLNRCGTPLASALSMADREQEGSMHNRQIPRAEWIPFFEGFNRRHEGRPATLSVMSSRFGAQLEARELPLEGVVASPLGSGSIAIHMGGDPGRNVEHPVSEPVRVWTELDDDGAEAAVQIESADGTKTILELMSSSSAGGIGLAPPEPFEKTPKNQGSGNRRNG